MKMTKIHDDVKGDRSIDHENDRLLTNPDLNTSTRTHAFSGVISDGCNPSSASRMAVTRKSILIGEPGTMGGN